MLPKKMMVVSMLVCLLIEHSVFTAQRRIKPVHQAPKKLEDIKHDPLQQAELTGKPTHIRNPRMTIESKYLVLDRTHPKLKNINKVMHDDDIQPEAHRPAQEISGFWIRNGATYIQVMGDDLDPALQYMTSKDLAHTLKHGAKLHISLRALDTPSQEDQFFISLIKTPQKRKASPMQSRPSKISSGPTTPQPLQESPL